MEKLNRLLSTIDDIFGNSPLDVRDIRLLRALKRIIDGGDSRLVAREFKLKGQGLDDLAQKVQQDDLPALLPYDELASPTELNRRRLGIAQILLGALAEERFEELIDSIAGARFESKITVRQGPIPIIVCLMGVVGQYAVSTSNSTARCSDLPRITLAWNHTIASRSRLTKSAMRCGDKPRKRCPTSSSC